MKLVAQAQDLMTEDQDLTEDQNLTENQDIVEDKKVLNMGSITFAAKPNIAVFCQHFLTLS